MLVDHTAGDGFRFPRLAGMLYPIALRVKEVINVHR